MAAAIYLSTADNGWVNGNTFANILCTATAICMQLVPGGTTANGSQISNNSFLNWNMQITGTGQKTISIVPTTTGAGAVNNIFVDGNTYDQASGAVVALGVGTFRNVITGALCITGGSGVTYSDSGVANQITDLSPGCGTGSPGQMNTFVSLYDTSGVRQGYISTAWGSVLPGNVTVRGTMTQGGGDYAESVDVIGSKDAYSTGDLLAISPSAPGRFGRSSAPYSTLVAGIYSTKPGTVGRRIGTELSQNTVPMALTGIVPTKVSSENGSIRPGDLLVSSSTPGYAMKGTDHSRMLGAVVGKSLGNLDRGSGVIDVMVLLK